MRNLSKLLLAAAVATAAVVAPGFAQAQAVTTTANMTVSATVAKSCVVTGPAAAVNFGAYDPVSTAQQSAQGTISVRCVRGTGYSIALSSTSGFNMTGTGGSIGYAILQPDGVSSWTASPLAVAAATVNTSAARPYVATVRPVIGADVPAGNYSDTVLVTVTY
jgi:spore coat protein U-like protein